MVNSSGDNATYRRGVPPGRGDFRAAVHHLHHFVMINQEESMPRGDKSKYTEKQKRQAEHIEEGYEKRGLSEEEAERRAWATVNKVHGGGEKPGGGGYGKPENHEPMRKGARKPHKSRSR